MAQVAQEVVQEAHRNRTATRAKRYVQCSLADMCARKHMNRSIICTWRQTVKMDSQTGRAKRYAQYCFEDMSALERFMLRELGCNFCNFANATSNCANIKSLKNHWKYV